MNNAVQILEEVVVGGDLSRIDGAERVDYYKNVCNSVGLNPLTKPFEYIKLNGKLTLYAKRDCTDQLRSLHGVSVKVLDTVVDDGLYIVRVAAQDKSGRHDEDMGAVPIAGLRGDARANAMAKAHTKAKRRVTLSICGLGWLDETEVEDINKAEPPTQSLDELFPEIEFPQWTMTFLDGEEVQLDSEEEWLKEYRVTMSAVAEATEEGPSARERMTLLKKFGEKNKEVIGKLTTIKPGILREERKALNSKLGAEAKNGNANV